jgi:hypothetical protein
MATVILLIKFVQIKTDSIKDLISPAKAQSGKEDAKFFAGFASLPYFAALRLCGIFLIYSHS